MPHRFISALVLAGALALPAALLGTPLLAATTITPLDPDAYGLSLTGNTTATNCNLQGLCNYDYASEVVTQTGPRTLSGVNGGEGGTDYSLAAAPELHATAWASMQGGGAGGGANYWQSTGSGFVQLQYFLRVDSPNGTASRIGVDLHAKGKVEAGGGPTNVSWASATASFRIDAYGGQFADTPLEYSRTARYDYDDRNTSIESLSFSLDGPIFMTSDQVYRVTMSVQALAQLFAPDYAYSNGPYYSDAWLDPYFTLSDELIAQGYGFSFSQGIVNSPVPPEEPGTPAPVPLPAAAPLLLAGLGTLALLRRRRTA